MTTDGDARRADVLRGIVDGDAWPSAGDMSVERARDLAWGLKDLCYACWSTDPPRALRAAAAAGRLRAELADGPQNPAQVEVAAVAAWTSGIANLIRGEMDLAVVQLDAASAKLRGIGLQLAAANTQVSKIAALAMLGRHDEAARCGRDARRVLLEHGDHAAAGRVGLNIGNLMLRSDRFAEAIEAFQAVIALFDRGGDRQHWVMASLGLGDALVAMGQLDDASRVYGLARQQAEEHDFAVLVALAEESAALLDLARGNYRAALAGLEGARRRYQTLEIPQPLAIAEKQLADAYLELRLLPEALAGFDAALARFEALDMQVDRAWTLVQRGRTLALLGHRAAAAGALVQAEGLFAAHDNPVGHASVALARAELALAGGDPKAAATLAERSAEGFGAAGLVERRLRADVVRAQALLAGEQAGPAWRLFDASLGDARERHLLPAQLRSLTGRAMAARQLGDHQSARSDLIEAVELFDDQWRTLPGDEIRSAFQGDHLLPFKELLRTELQAHDEGRCDALDVLVHLDRFRARTLADRLEAAPRLPATSDGLRQSTLPEDAAPELRARLAWLYARQRRQHDDADASHELTRQLRALEHDLHERNRRARLVRPAEHVAPRGDDLPLGQLQRVLAQGDALVEYGVVDDELLACVVLPHGVHVRRRIASWSQVLNAARSARFQLESLRDGVAPVRRHLPTLALRTGVHLARLHGLVWRPLEDLLDACSRVLIVPCGALGTVPMAALHDGTRCIAERHELAFAASAQVALRGLMIRNAPARRVLALGEATRLPYAGQEARLVASLLPEGQAFFGEDATVACLRAHSAEADVVHLACHAEFRVDNPLFSALHLHDAALTAEAIEALPLRQATVVLSGCETARYGDSSGDEMFGLVRAFLIGGAARVMASHWPVDDEFTATLMEAFYFGLRSGMTPAAALRQAQLASRARQEHPFFWASFSLYGGW